MSVTETIQTSRQDPAIEAYRLGLLGDVQGYIKKQIESGDMPPDYQIADLSPAEMAAATAAQQGVGSYQPYLNQGQQSLQAGQGFMQQGAASLAGTDQMYDPRTALGIAQQGMNRFAQTTGAYDPSSARGYMNEYEDQAVQQALSDVARAGQTQQAQLGANAVASGAFGGARQGIAQAELGRNVLEQQGRTAAQMRQAGYESAAQRSQSAFEQQQARSQAAAQNAAALGMSAEQFAASGMESAMTRRQAAAGAYGNLGQGIGSLGIQQAGLGEMRQGLNTQDISNLMTTGANQRGIQQAGLDAMRLSNLQRYTQPYQQYGFLSDIYSGTPTGSSTLTAASAPQVSPFQTAIGLGISGLSAAAGAQRAGIF